MKSVVITILLMLTPHLCGAKIVLPDSMLTVRKSYAFHITSPDTAWAIVETMRERKLAPEWELDMVEGDLNFNLRRYRKAVPFYQKVQACPALVDSTFLQLLMLKRQMDCYDAMLLDDELVHVILQLRSRAEAVGNKAFEAMTYAMSGKWHHFHGQKDKGYGSCRQALEMMQASDYPGKHIELGRIYGELVNMYARDHRYDEAMRMSELQEAEARQPRPDGIRLSRERALRRVFALRASMLAGAGRMAEAGQAYAAWMATPGGNDIDDMLIYDYLRLGKRYDEALGIISRYREFIHAYGDTLTFRMLSVNNKEALLHIDMGNYLDAAMHGRKINNIIDSIFTHRSSEQMQTVYDLYQEQKASYKKTLWLSILTLGLIALLIMALLVLYYNRHIHRRNIKLLKVLNSLDAYRRSVVNGEPMTSPEVVRAIDEMKSLQLSSDLPTKEVGESDDEDRRLFIEMDKQVTRDQLFLKPGLGREDLMRLIGVDKNRFGKMMSKYSDASNTSVYINTKRVEFGARLLLEQPEYTIATIATECGMSNTVTFNRTFKEVYGITPSEYREKMKHLLNAETVQPS